MKEVKKRFQYLIIFSFIILLAGSFHVTANAASRELEVTLDANGGIFPKNWPQEESETRIVKFTISDTGSVSYSNVGLKPTLEGYTFLGWDTDKTATSPRYNDQFNDGYPDYKYFSMDGSITKLYAIWAKTYTITLDANGGNFGTETDKYGKTTPIVTISRDFWWNGGLWRNQIPEAKKEGLVHKGWSSSKTATKPEYGTTFEGLKLNSSTPATLYAIYGKAGDSSTDYSATVAKKANPMKIKIKSKTYKRAKLTKKKTFTIGVSKAKGKVTYTLNKKAKKAKIKVSKKGKVTIPKKCKKGTYKITVKAAGNSSYNAGKKVVTIKVK